MRFRRRAQRTPLPTGPIRDHAEAVSVALEVLDEMVHIALSGTPVSVMQREGWPAGLSVRGTMNQLRVLRYLDRLAAEADVAPGI